MRQKEIFPVGNKQFIFTWIQVFIKIEVQSSLTLRSQEPLKPHLQPIPVRVIFAVLRKDDLLAVERLETILQHRTIGLFQDVISHMDIIIGVDAEDVLVESSVVDLA